MIFDDIQKRSFKYRYWLGLFILLSPWGIVILIRELGPITYGALSNDYVFFLFLFLSLSFLFYSVGFSVRKNAPKTMNVNDTSWILNRYHQVSIFFLILYLSSTYYDFFIIKQGSIYTITIMRALDNISGGRDSFLGAVSAITSAAPPIAFILNLMNKKCPKLKRDCIYVGIFFGFCAMFFCGGRNSFFISLLFIYSYHSFLLKKNAKIKKNNKIGSKLTKIFLGTIVILGIIYSMSIFLERGALSGNDSRAMVGMLALEYNVSVYDPPIDNSMLASLYAIIIYLIYYITHSLSFSNQYFTESFNNISMGAYSFPQIARLIDVLFSTSFFKDAQQGLIVSGVYLSLPGGLFIDFGYGGSLIIGGLLSYMLGFLYRNIYYLALYQYFIFPYLVVLFIFSPIYTVFGTGNGISIIFIIICFMILRIRFKFSERIIQVN